MAAFHLAQVNVARLVAPLDSPQLIGFVSRLDEVNALADRAPGFVWRLTGDGGNDATAVPIYDDDKIIVNMSVWESIDALRDYVYRSAHAGILRRRQEWFERMREAFVALWWIEAGTLPTIDDARERLAALRADGPTPYAFTLKQPFPVSRQPPAT
jgi:Domain of unknown function (DUF3291)